MSKLTQAKEQILQALRSNQVETVNIGLSEDLSEAEMIELAKRPILRIGRTARIKGDLLRKKQASAAAEAAKKGW